MGIKIFSLTLVAAISFSNVSSKAQAPASIAVTHAPKWTPIKEKDVLWRKRVWRTIDVHEKGNELFAATNPNGNINPFIGVIMQGVKEGKIDIYTGDTDRFITKLSYEELQKQISDGKINISNISKYKIKEDWMFDSSQHKLETRILGIAPMCEVKSKAGEVAYEPVFWVTYFQSVSYFTAQYIANYVPNDEKTWYDVIERREFKSKIDKINDSKPGAPEDIDALIAK